MYIWEYASRDVREHGWNARLAGEPRVVREGCGDTDEMAERFLEGWDAADERLAGEEEEEVSENDTGDTREDSPN